MRCFHCWPQVCYCKYFRGQWTEGSFSAGLRAQGKEEVQSQMAEPEPVPQQAYQVFSHEEPQRCKLQRKGEGERGLILDSDSVPCSDSVDSDSVVCSDSVVSHISYVSNLTKELVDSCKNFKAGCINSCFEAWSNITSDSDILHMVKGLKIELNSFDNCSPGEKKASLSVEEEAFIDAELLKLEAKGVISKCFFF